jgi:nicotinate-nucleotide pyrophosphorylase (carboxylating)
MTHDSAIDLDQFESILKLARREDWGDTGGDLTSLLLPEPAYSASATWKLVSRQPGRFCGGVIIEPLLTTLAPEVRLDWLRPRCDSEPVSTGQEIARFSGLVCQMLAAERTILNFLQHLSGVATLTGKFVSAVAGTHAKIYDTRKTTPGLRSLEKYAVRCGGGHNHRIGLYDAVLIKDNHVSGIPVDRLAHAIFEMLNRIETLPVRPAFVEVECDGLDQLSELLKVVGIDVILLDNFEVDNLRKAVEMRNDAGLRGKVELEASGGATLETVRAIAQSGVERIAVGAITHSAGSLDLGLDVA